MKKIMLFWRMLPIILVIFFGIAASRSLLTPGYFVIHDDLQMMRQLQLEKCFLDGQIPCRWVPDMGYGYGYPLFNYYPPMPYLMGEVFRTFGFAFTDTVKILFALSVIISGVTMYGFAKEFFGRLGGLVSSVFYMWAPYHAVDVFVRGAMNEAWALAWFPLIFWSGYRLLTEKQKKRTVSGWGLLFSVSLFLLFISHNLMVLIFVPVFGLWLLVEIIRRKAPRTILRFIPYGLLGLGLAAFFTVPAILENNLTQIRLQLTGYYDYRAHFVSIYQLLFSRFWDYGPSIWGTEDGMPFPVGHLHWILSLAAAVLLLREILLRKAKLLVLEKENSRTVVALIILVFGWLATFLTHQKSYIIWDLIPQLSYLQFPWRFLTITTFSFSFLSGYVVYKSFSFSEKLTIFARVPIRIIKSAAVVFLVTLLVVLNWNFFKAKGMNADVDDTAKFSGVAWQLQQAAGIYDYLPKTAKTAPDGSRRELTEIMEGVANVSNVAEGTNWALFDVSVNSDQAKIRINILDFPNWRVFANNIEIAKYIPEDELFGRFWIDLPQGEYEISAKLYNTPVRTASNVISAVSFAILAASVYLRKRHTR